MKGSDPVKTGPLVSALPIFPGRRQPSIFGASELNCRVRDGNGWTLTAISTDFVGVDFATLLFQPLARLKPLLSPQSVPTPGGVVHLQGLEPWTP